MRAISTAALEAIEAGFVARRNALWFDVGAGIGVWDDIYDIAISGRTYQGKAGRFQMGALPSVSDGSVQGLDVVFSGVDQTVYNFLVTEAWHQKPMQALVLLIDPASLGVLDHRVWFAGFVDTAKVTERTGGETVLTVSCESISRDLERRGAATRSEASQRRIDADDGFFKHAAQMATREVYWGRKGPQRAPGRRPRRGGGGNLVGRG
jgi:hypothetical protein